MSPPRREYFYELDRHGRLRHDGTLLADAGFLDQFFRRLRPNDTGRHAGHPWLSVCAGEHNFLRAEDRPVVFKQLLPDETLRHAGSLVEPFQPASLRHRCGQLYHPAPVGAFGLIAPALAMAFGERIEPDGDDYVLLYAGEAWPVMALDGPLPGEGPVVGGEAPGS